MDPALKAARMEIASEVGADVGNFTPPDEKRFTGVEIMLVVGGALLYGFLNGLAKKVGEKVGEKVGDKVLCHARKCRGGKAGPRERCHDVRGERP